MTRKTRTPLILLERVVPHYRDAVFQGLYDRFGWKVVCAERPPTHTAHQFLTDREYIVPYPFVFPNPRDHNSARIPLTQILADLSPEVIISDFALRMTSTRSLALRRLMGLRPYTLFWSHGANMDRQAPALTNTLVAAARLAMMRMVDGQIVYSEEGKEYLEKHLGSQAIFVAANTMDDTNIRAAALKAAPRTDLGKPVLLSAGRFTQNKNYVLLVRAFKKLLVSMPSASLVLIGNGPDEERVRKEAGAALGKNIIMPGGIYDEEKLAPYFKSADVFVVPGAAGLSVNHALAYGVPVVAFERSATGPFHHPEITYVKPGVSGWLVRPYSEDALASFLLDLFNRCPRPAEHLRPGIEQFVSNHMTLEVMLSGFARARDWLISLGIEGI